jgi:hypothetical protein
MVRATNLPVIVGVVLILLLAGCGSVERVVPQAAFTIYGHNNRARDAWFGLAPPGDPSQSVGFGADLGVACLHGPVGAAVVRFDGPPGQGGLPLQEVGTIVGEGPPGSNVFWVSVAANGSLTTGSGVPAWWVGDAQAC